MGEASDAKFSVRAVSCGPSGPNDSQWLLYLRKTEGQMQTQTSWWQNQLPVCSQLLSINDLSLV